MESQMKQSTSLLAVVCASGVFALAACGKKEKAPAAPAPAVAVSTATVPVEILEPIAPVVIEPLNVYVPAVVTPAAEAPSEAAPAVAAEEAPAPVASAPAAAAPAAPAAASVLQCAHGTVTEVETDNAGQTIATATRCRPAPR
jgi:hypothetical protein